jgi:DNA repair protein RadD
VSHKEEGGYRTFLAALLAINPAMRVVGLTATPYRMGHGLITDAPALFHALIEPVSIEQLLHLGHLAPLKSKATKAKYDTTGVHKRGGDFIESELQKVVDTTEQNDRVVAEILDHAADRKSWLVFCTGVDHSLHIAEALRQKGIATETVTGDTPKNERRRILSDFKAGKLRAVTNANVLTTGFDHPPIDMIAMLRPTKSARLFVQMAVRGMRVSPGKENCLVLDFAGVVETLGPVTNPQIAGKAGDGVAPMKPCAACNELVHIAARTCPACGEPFPEAKKDPTTEPIVLVETDIMGLDAKDLHDLEVKSWRWHVGRGAKSGREQIVITYYGRALSDAPATEYLCVTHDGFTGQRAWSTLSLMASSAGLPAGTLATEDLGAICEGMNASKAPAWIQTTREGKFTRITKRHWA